MKKRFAIPSILVFFIFLSASANALFLGESSCKDDGTLSFRVTTDELNSYLYFNESSTIKVTTPKSEILSVPTNWSRNELQGGSSSSYQTDNYFYQNEILIANWSGVYKVDINFREFNYKNGSSTPRNYNFEIKNCPGLLFSCRLVGLNLDDCYTMDNKFYAYFTANLDKQSDETNAKTIDVEKGLIYTVESNEKYMETTGNLVKRGKLPKGYSIKKISKDKYLLQADFANNLVKNLYIEYSKEPDYYFMSECFVHNANYGGRQLTISKTCGIKPSIELPKVEEKKEEQKPQVKNESVSETPKTEPIKEEVKPKEESKEKPAEKETPKFEEAKPVDYKYIWISVLVITIILIVVFIIVKRKSEDNLL